MATTTTTLTVPYSNPDAAPGYFNNPGHGFKNAVVKFEDGSVWRITQPLSRRVYSTGCPPCEARQVFSCVCIRNPDDKYKDVKEAVMKVKYQVHADEDTIARIKSDMQYEEEWLKRSPETYKNTYTENMEALEQELHQASNPVERSEVNESTRNEYLALKHFAKTDCSSAPHLLSYVLDQVEEGIDNEHAIIGGYAFFMLMTKVPGEHLSYWKFRDLKLSERDKIRQAFKQALIDVWSHQISPQDCAPRNIIWDKEMKKCYIVDFEKYDEVEWQCPAEKWNDDYFERWHLKDHPKGNEPHDYYFI